MNYQLVIFDWDGTLMDSIPKIVTCLQQTAQVLNLPVPEVEAARAVIGLSLHRAVETLFPDTQLEVSKMMQTYQHLYREVDTTPTPLFDDVVVTLKGLRQRGVCLGVATGKYRAGLQRALSATELSDYFDATRTADEADSKPAPMMIQQIMSQTNYNVAHTVMIGDSPLDMEMAKRAGVDAIGITTGVADEQQLRAAGACIVVDNYLELQKELGW